MSPEVLDALFLWLTPIFYIGGLVTAVALPYFNAKRENPSISFDWGYVKWQVAFALLGFLPTLAATLNIAQLEVWAGQGIMGWLLAYGAGFGFGRGGREVQKTAGKG